MGIPGREVSGEQNRHMSVTSCSSLASHAKPPSWVLLPYSPQLCPAPSGLFTPSLPHAYSLLPGRLAPTEGSLTYGSFTLNPGFPLLQNMSSQKCEVPLKLNKSKSNLDNLLSPSTILQFPASFLLQSDTHHATQRAETQESSLLPHLPPHPYSTGYHFAVEVACSQSSPHCPSTTAVTQGCLLFPRLCL